MKKSSLSLGQLEKYLGNKKMKEKREYWQSVRGICILAVVLIHSLGEFDYSTGYNVEFVILRQIINFAVATFVFMAGYFVNVDAMSDNEFNCKKWIIYRGATVYSICDLVAVV